MQTQTIGYNRQKPVLPRVARKTTCGVTFKKRSRLLCKWFCELTFSSKNVENRVEAFATSGNALASKRERMALKRFSMKLHQVCSGGVRR